jgi:hypothetical protein
MTTHYQGREKWRYVTRGTYYGCLYDIWELVANPRIGYKIGKRCAVHIK